MNHETQPSASAEAALVPVRGRMISADVLRVFACLSVISVHFVWHIGFYDQPIAGVNMMVLLVMRIIFTPCVPLFLILTGYLNVHKPLSKKHYSKGMKVVWLYLLASVFVIIYRVYIKHDIPNLSGAIWGVLKFETDPYAWYIEMYIGLYLLIPFVNILYKNIPTKRWKQVLIITCIVLNSLPCILNVYNFVQAGWWDNPLSSYIYQHLIPQWWVLTYPLTYYLIGAYMREYSCGFSRLSRRLLLIITLTLAVFYCLWRASGGKFPVGPWIDWNSPFILLIAVLIASLILRKEYRRIPSFLAKCLGYVSGLTLEIFLVSYIFDMEYYPILNRLIPEAPQRLWTYIIMVPAVFLSSLAVSAVIDLIYRLFGFGYGRLKDRVKQNRSAGNDAEAVLQDAVTQTNMISGETSAVSEEKDKKSTD